MNNQALSMLELSKKYALATSEAQKTLLAGAGEALLAKGAHGGWGVFMGFILPTLAGVMMSWVMLQGKIFSRIISYIGISGNSLMLLYLILVTAVPGVGKMAMAFALPGGTLVLIWMIMFTIKLFGITSPQSPIPKND
jgi:hypothetical protein